MYIPSQPEWTMSWMNLYVWQALFSAIQAVIVFLVMLIVSAVMIPYERRMLGLWQDRYGPNRVGWQGSLQLVADMVKIMFKEDWRPDFADKTTFMIAPFISMFSALVAFVVIPVSPMLGGSDWNIGILFFLAMAGLSVYSVMFAGWGSSNKFALLGALRSTAQTISYEVFLGLSLMGVVAIAGSFNMRDIVESQRDVWNIVPQFFGFLCFLVAGTAVAHRFPFDLPEAESELSEGYHIEYSGMKFGMFYVGQYVNVVVVSAFMTTLFFGGWLPPFGWDIPYIAPTVWFALKTLIFMTLFTLTYASIMRPRYDQLMNFGWKICLPLALINLMVTAAVILLKQS